MHDAQDGFHPGAEVVCSWAEDPPDEDSAPLMRGNAAWIKENRADLEHWL